MSFFTPLVYIIVVAFWLTHMKWLRRAGFGKRFVWLFFVAKCLAGFAYNFIALHLPHRGDIWPFFDDGVEMYRLFLQSPQAFFQTYGQIFHYSDFNATNTHSDFIRSAFEVIRLLHFGLNFLTGGNLWGNTVLFNFGATLCFFYCWRFLKQQSKEQGWFIGLVFLLLPSMFFYSAGILKEGIVISLLCLLIPLSYRLISRFSLKVLLVWLLLFALLSIIKIFVAGLWLAAMLLWVLLRWFPARQGWVTLIAIAIAIPVFFYSNHVIPSINLPGYLIKRQQEFLTLPAGSSINIVPLTKQPGSYIKAFPVALNNVLFKPLPGEGGNVLYSLYAIEMILSWLWIGTIIWKRKKESIPAHQSMAIVFLTFAFFNLLFIGLIIPNIGSIIRYRSIFMPFVAVAVILLCRPVFISEKWNRALEKWISQ